MSDLIVAAVKIAFLALVWLFILFVADIIRRDMFGRTIRAKGSARGDAAQLPPPEIPTRFTITQGNQQGLSVPVQPTINLGRAADSTFHLDDDYSSARHAQLVQVDAQTWLVHDLGSTNGTYVNGQLVTAPTPVTTADVIRIGRTHMRLEA